MKDLSPYAVTKYLDTHGCDPDSYSFSNRIVGDIILSAIRSTAEQIGVNEQEWIKIGNRLMGDYARTPTPVPDEYSNKLKDLIE